MPASPQLSLRRFHVHGAVNVRQQFRGIGKILQAAIVNCQIVFPADHKKLVLDVVFAPVQKNSERVGTAFEDIRPGLFAPSIRRTRTLSPVFSRMALPRWEALTPALSES